METSMSQDAATKKTAEPEKLDLRSHDVVADKVRELLCLFPEIRTEDGKLDFDRLKLAIGQSVDVGKERFVMNWPGKADCFKTIQSPSVGALRPCAEESVNFDTSANLIIEGDNLEVLKLLQKSYLGKIKLVYIDPPYNRGKDFIYPDNYSENLETYLEYTGQVDSEGSKFGTNTETDGRFHSKWLNMIYPRLYLGRNLLRDDGVFMISIDDGEVNNLRRVCDDVFGEENFVAQLVWEKGRKNDAKFFSLGHDYVVIYAKSVAHLREMKVIWREQKPGAQEIWDQYLLLRTKHVDDDRAIETDLQRWFQSLSKDHPSKTLTRYRRVDKNGPWRDRDISWPGGDGPRYDVIHPRTKLPCKVPDSGWRFSKAEDMQRQIALGLVEFREDHTEPPFAKTHVRPISDELIDTEEDADSEIAETETEEVMASQVRGSYFYKQSQVAVKYLKKLMGAKLFDNPKDHEELLRLFRYVIGPDRSAIVLDFFAGSGSTAEAVLQLNQEDAASHRFVLVQLPEPCNPKERTGKAALKAGFLTIADIAKERLRRVVKRLENESEGVLAFEKASGRDLGFRVFKLSESNFTGWDANVSHEAEPLARQLELHVEHIRAGRTADDLLYELLLKSGFPLTTAVEKLTLAGKTVYSVAGGALMICLEPALTLELIRAIADRKPERVVLLDEGFAGNDQLKANAVQTFKTKGVTSFKTV
jgi:adenine-specific DNA-methyltransferase